MMLQSSTQKQNILSHSKLFIKQRFIRPHSKIRIIFKSNLNDVNTFLNEPILNKLTLHYHSIDS